MAKEKRSIKGFRAFIGRIDALFNRQKIQKRGGFTLIELLVVVLIIGILTSVALPQYQRSVMKARFAQAKIAANALADAMDVYYAAHMGYTAVLDNLDVSIDITSLSTSCTQTSDSCVYGTSWGRCFLENDGRAGCTINGANLSYYIFCENSTKQSLAGKKYCRVERKANPNDWEYKFCQQETGSSTTSSWSSVSTFEYVK